MFSAVWMERGGTKQQLVQLTRKRTFAIKSQDNITNPCTAYRLTIHFSSIMTNFTFRMGSLTHIAIY